ncbi:MAG: hypothetical protein KBT40_00920 [bacterium]|nr:hypothetical protein [Candidatus Minthenecus merdequi]
MTFWTLKGNIFSRYDFQQLRKIDAKRKECLSLRCLNWLKYSQFRKFSAKQ